MTKFRVTPLKKMALEASTDLNRDENEVLNTDITNEYRKSLYPRS